MNYRNRSFSLVKLVAYLLKHKILRKAISINVYISKSQFSLNVFKTKFNFDTQDEESLLHAMGTASVVVQVTGTNWPKPLYTLLVTGLCRFRIDKIVMEEPYLIAEVTQLDRPTEQGTYCNFCWSYTKCRHLTEGGHVEKYCCL